MAPGTEFARDFCAGMGPLQLGVGLVYMQITSFHISVFTVYRQIKCLCILLLSGLYKNLVHEGFLEILIFLKHFMDFQITCNFQ